MRVVFYTEHLSLRGTEIALYDYAKYNQELLGNESFIVINSQQPEHKNPTRGKFEKYFNKVYSLDGVKQLENFISENKIDVFYRICSGTKEPLPSNCRTAVHVVFSHFTPFGDKYAYVSEWLYKHSVPENQLENFTFVPHMIDLSDTNDDLRKSLNIPIDAKVFGYHGGSDSFDVDFARTSVKKALDKGIYFVFMNIPSFAEHQNIRFLEGTSDLNYKTKFINTCDGMIHARSRGETFGISIGEFSSRNKPIITFGQSPERNHIMVLKDKALVYNNQKELDNILQSFDRKNTNNINYDCYTKLFNPQTVMKTFNEVFL
jgi:hypothetical protein